MAERRWKELSPWTQSSQVGKVRRLAKETAFASKVNEEPIEDGTLKAKEERGTNCVK